MHARMQYMTASHGVIQFELKDFICDDCLCNGQWENAFSSKGTSIVIQKVANGQWWYWFSYKVSEKAEKNKRSMAFYVNLFVLSFNEDLALQCQLVCFFSEVTVMLSSFGGQSGNALVICWKSPQVNKHSSLWRDSNSRYTQQSKISSPRFAKVWDVFLCSVQIKISVRF